MERRFTIILEQRILEDALALADLEKRQLRDQLAWVVEEWVRLNRHRLTAPSAGMDPPATDILSAAAAIA